MQPDTTWCSATCSTVALFEHNHVISTVLAEHPKTTFFRLFLENAKFKSRKNLDRKLNNFATNNFSSSFTWYIQIFRPMASFRELSCTSRPCLLYIVDGASKRIVVPQKVGTEYKETLCVFLQRKRTPWLRATKFGRGCI